MAEVFQYIAARQRRNHYRPVNIALSIACRDLRMSKRMWLRMVRILEAAGWLYRLPKTGGEHNPGTLYRLSDLAPGAYPLSPNGHGPARNGERSRGTGDNDPISRELWPPDPVGVQAFDPRIQKPHPSTHLANVPYITSERSQLGERIGDVEINSEGANVPEIGAKVALPRIPERSLGERSSLRDSSPAPSPVDGDTSAPLADPPGAVPSPNPSPGRGLQPSTSGGIPVRVYNGEDFTVRRGGPPPEIQREVAELFRRRGVPGWRAMADPNSNSGGNAND